MGHRQTSDNCLANESVVAKSVGRQWVNLDAFCKSCSLRGHKWGKCWRCIQFTTDNWLFSLFFPSIFHFFLFFVFISYISFVFFWCCKQNQHKLKTIINMSGLSER